jgi:hypothetical protein
LRSFTIGLLSGGKPTWREYWVTSAVDPKETWTAFQKTEFVIPRNLFADILRPIAELQPPPTPLPREEIGCHAYQRKLSEKCVSIKTKSTSMARIGQM